MGAWKIIASRLRNVRFGSVADMNAELFDVRLIPPN